MDHYFPSWTKSKPKRLLNNMSRENKSGKIEELKVFEPTFVIIITDGLIIFEHLVS